MIKCTPGNKPCGRRCIKASWKCDEIEEAISNPLKKETEAFVYNSLGDIDEEIEFQVQVSNPITHYKLETRNIKELQKQLLDSSTDLGESKAGKIISYKDGIATIKVDMEKFEDFYNKKYPPKKPHPLAIWLGQYQKP